MKKYNYLIIISIFILTISISNVFAIQKSSFNEKSNIYEYSDKLNLSKYEIIDNFSINEYNDKLDVSYSNNHLKFEVKIHNNSIYYIYSIDVRTNSYFYTQYQFYSRDTMYYKDKLSIPNSFTYITVKVNLACFSENHIIARDILESTIVYNEIINPNDNSENFIEQLINSDNNLFLILILSLVIAILSIFIVILLNKYHKGFI